MYMYLYKCPALVGHQAVKARLVGIGPSVPSDSLDGLLVRYLIGRCESVSKPLPHALIK